MGEVHIQSQEKTWKMQEKRKRRHTAKNDVSFQMALSRLLFALLPRNMGFVHNDSNKFISNSTLFPPVVSEL